MGTPRKPPTRNPSKPLGTKSGPSGPGKISPRRRTSNTVSGKIIGGGKALAGRQMQKVSAKPLPKSSVNKPAAAARKQVGKTAAKQRFNQQKTGDMRNHEFRTWKKEYLKQSEKRSLTRKRGRQVLKGLGKQAGQRSR